MKTFFLSIVIPTYNEEQVLPELYRRLHQMLVNISGAYEIIFVDDGSTDKTRDILRDLREKDSCVKLLFLSRNFGHQIAITAGIDYTTGENVVVMDADLQDPPEVIPKMLEQRAKGYDIVYAVRTQRHGETVFKLLTARFFYKLLNKLTGLKMPVGVGDFRLLSRRAADKLKRLREQNRYVRGLACWIGYPQTAVYFERPSRYAGKTKFNTLKMLRFALDGITSFSYIPLRLAMFFGFFIALICLIYILYVLFLKITGGYLVQGWPSTIVAVLFIGAIQLICLGIIGEYIGRIYDEAKKRPIYIVSQSFGFDEQSHDLKESDA